MREGSVLYADHDHVHVLRYVGDVRHPLASSVSGFVEGLLPRMNGDALVFDLSDADAIDSTNLGEMARIADRLSEFGVKRPAIISTRPEISQVLFSMAFDEVFDICTEPNGSQGGEPIVAIPTSREAALKGILSAHRRLMQMSESNRKQFSAVVELLERELGPDSSDVQHP
jgi:anti-anti-sigma regulatory factor